jgi:hypothetical protein
VSDREKLTRWCKGVEEAVDFLELFFYVCHFWDDLVDKDKERDAQDAAWISLVDLPENRFYREHFRDLHPVVTAAVNDWFTANTLERQDDHGRDIAYSLRCSILTVITHCAYLIGGPLWVREVGPEIRLYGQRETLAEYKKEFEDAQHS